MERRTFLLNSGAALIAVTASRVKADSPDPSLIAIETELGGRIGVAALDTGSGAWLRHRADERFAMCSTFKWMLAAAVLDKTRPDEAALDRPLHYDRKDLLEYAPVTAAHISEGALSVRALCEAAVELSDNTAANLLLTLIGGPPALTRYLRRTGDHTTRLDRTEPSLNTNIPNDLRDTTTPAAMVATMQRILLGEALPRRSRELLIDWLKKCQTGTHRLRAGLPKDWTVGDKTGTGSHESANDVAIAWPAQRAPLLIAAYMSGSGAPAEALDAAHAKIGGAVARAFGAP
jgi:beta-lactamase class A